MDTFIFIVLFIVTIGSACIVAFSRNLIYSAFALFGAFAGVAGTFVLLNSPLLGLVQFVVYAGGILVLTIFAVMLTSKISDREESNPVMNYKAVIPLVLMLVLVIVRVVMVKPWDKVLAEAGFVSTTTEVGNQLLTNYLFPFELVSVVLLMAMLGAAIVSRRKVKE